MNDRAKKYLKTALAAPTVELKNDWIKEAMSSLDDADCGLGALRVVVASAHNSTPKQLAAVAQAGIDLVERGEEGCAKMRGDADAYLS